MTALYGLLGLLAYLLHLNRGYMDTTIEVILWIYLVMSVIFLCAAVACAIDHENIFDKVKWSNVTNVITLLAFISSPMTRILIMICKFIYLFFTCDFRKSKDK